MRATPKKLKEVPPRMRQAVIRKVAAGSVNKSPTEDTVARAPDMASTRLKPALSVKKPTNGRAKVLM